MSYPYTTAVKIPWKKILEVLVALLTAIIGALTLHSCR